MLSGGLQATGTRDQSFSFILPYLGFTPSPSHFPLAQKTQETWLGKKEAISFFPIDFGGEGQEIFTFEKMVFTMIRLCIH